MSYGGSNGTRTIFEISSITASLPVGCQNERGHQTLQSTWSCRAPGACASLRFETDPKAADPHPLQGLLRFGPFTRNKLAAIVDPIRCGHHCAKRSGQARRAVIEGDATGAVSSANGDTTLWHFQASQRSSTGQMGVAGRESDHRASCRHDRLNETRTAAGILVLAEALTRALSALRNNRAAFDVVFILLSQEWEEGFFGGSEDDFDLHHYVKAVAPWKKGYRRSC